jgi:hypothetical protein
MVYVYPNHNTNLLKQLPVTWFIISRPDHYSRGIPTKHSIFHLQRNSTRRAVSPSQFHVYCSLSYSNLTSFIDRYQSLPQNRPEFPIWRPIYRSTYTSLFNRALPRCLCICTCSTGYRSILFMLL